MEDLQEHEQELDYRCNVSDGLEVQLVYNSLLSMAYTKVEDRKTGQKFSSLTPDGVHPRESFIHPFMYRVGDVAQATGVELVTSDEGREQE